MKFLKLAGMLLMSWLLIGCVRINVYPAGSTAQPAPLKAAASPPMPPGVGIPKTLGETRFMVARKSKALQEVRFTIPHMPTLGTLSFDDIRLFDPELPQSGLKTIRELRLAPE